MAQVKAPVLFCGGEGGPASGAYDSWAAAHLPEGTVSEVCMAQLVDIGVGGMHAHGTVVRIGGATA